MKINKNNLTIVLLVATTFLSSCKIFRKSIKDDSFEALSLINPHATFSSRNINVCWENDLTPEFQKERGWFQKKVEEQYHTKTALRFRHWGSCKGLREPAIHITVRDYLIPRMSAISFGGHKRMNFTFTFKDIKDDQGKEILTECREPESKRKLCIQLIAVHELGHGIGLQHEQLRDDTPDSCTAGQKDEKLSRAYVAVGHWDANSVMNYCSPNWSNHGNLTRGDVQGVHQLYPYSKEEVLNLYNKILNRDPTNEEIKEVYSRLNFGVYFSEIEAWLRGETIEFDRITKITEFYKPSESHIAGDQKVYFQFTSTGGKHTIEAASPSDVVVALYEGENLYDLGAPLKKVNDEGRESTETLRLELDKKSYIVMVTLYKGLGEGDVSVTVKPPHNDGVAKKLDEDVYRVILIDKDGFSFGRPDKEAEVKIFKEKLEKLGYRIWLDGKYNNEIKSIVGSLQQKHNLRDQEGNLLDGSFVDGQTMELIDRLLSAVGD